MLIVYNIDLRAKATGQEGMYTRYLLTLLTGGQLSLGIVDSTCSVRSAGITRKRQLLSYKAHLLHLWETPFQASIECMGWMSWIQIKGWCSWWADVERRRVMWCMGEGNIRVAFDIHNSFIGYYIQFLPSSNPSTLGLTLFRVSTIIEKTWKTLESSFFVVRVLLIGSVITCVITWP